MNTDAGGVSAISGGLGQSQERKLLAGLQSLKVLLGADSPEVRGWAPVVQQAAQRLLNAAISIEAENERLREALAAEREQMRALIADDAWALTFQTLGQYRSALLRALTPNAQVSGPTGRSNL